MIKIELTADEQIFLRYYVERKWLYAARFMSYLHQFPERGWIDPKAVPKSAANDRAMIKLLRLIPSLRLIFPFDSGIPIEDRLFTLNPDQHRWLLNSLQFESGRIQTTWNRLLDPNNRHFALEDEAFIRQGPKTFRPFQLVMECLYQFVQPSPIAWSKMKGHITHYTVHGYVSEIEKSATQSLAVSLYARLNRLYNLEELRSEAVARAAGFTPDHLGAWSHHSKPGLSPVHFIAGLKPHQVTKRFIFHQRQKKRLRRGEGLIPSFAREDRSHPVLTLSSPLRLHVTENLGFLSIPHAILH